MYFFGHFSTKRREYGTKHYSTKGFSTKGHESGTKGFSTKGFSTKGHESGTKWFFHKRFFHEMVFHEKTRIWHETLFHKRFFHERTRIRHEMVFPTTDVLYTLLIKADTPMLSSACRVRDWSGILCERSEQRYSGKPDGGAGTHNYGKRK